MGKEDVARAPLSWPTTVFIVSTTLVAAAWPVYAYFYGVTAAQIALALAYYVATGMSITVGYHRMVSHRAFRCQPWLEALFLAFGAAAWQGSALDWAADHVRHHSYTDTRRDPYNIKQGFWHAHIGWLFRHHQAASPPAFLTSNKLIMLQDRYYVPLAVTVSFVIPYLLAGTGGLLLAGVLRLVVVHHTTWFINSWAHVGRRRPYDPDISAADNWFLSFFTFGEGFHNYHHSFPSDYRNGVSPWAWDPSKWLIWALSKIGVAYDLKRIESVTQWKRRVRSAIEHVPDAGDKFARLRLTRASLERQIERSRVRLAKVLDRDRRFEAPTRQELRDEIEELRARLSQAIHDATQAITAASRARLERARAMLDNLAAYQAMLEQLAAHEASLAATA